jgi:hypothetical protein
MRGPHDGSGLNQVVFIGIRCAEEVIELDLLGARQTRVTLAFNGNVFQFDIAQARVRFGGL